NRRIVLEGYVKDIGTKKPLPGIELDVTVLSINRTTKVGTASDNLGHYKCSFDANEGETYYLECYEHHVNGVTPTWYWVDVNKQPNVLGVGNSGEKLTNQNIQNIDMYMGRYASFDSLIFHTNIPFVKGDTILTQIEDKYHFCWDGQYITPGVGSNINIDSIYQYVFKGIKKRGLANSNEVFITMKGTRQSIPFTFNDTLFIPSDNSRKVIHKIIP
ncbi:MAG: hypothetical protein HYZ42_07045, partial [Bacteroidetes bacterium]|nr:hypothetical protein [Bacteroidota bacterium]